MITTKQNELHIINSFNDLIKDTKEKQNINRLVKQYSSDYFMEKLSDAELEDGLDNLDIFKELSQHYQKYAYIITRRIFDRLKEENSSIEEYYDGTVNEKGAQVKKERQVFDKNRFGEEFAASLEEELNNLVVEDYFKNLNKTLEVHNFNTKIQKLEKDRKKKDIECNRAEIENIIYNDIESTYDYYKRKGDKRTILYNLKHNRNVVNYLLELSRENINKQLGIEIKRADLKKMYNELLDMFISMKDKEEEDKDDDSKIPLGWKAYAITKFIDKMLK